MPYSNPGLIKNFSTGAAIEPYRIVTFSAANTVSPATASDTLIGVAGTLPADADARIDVTLTGIAQVEYGGNVSRGDFLTSDANGKAVAASPGGGTNAPVLGIAMDAGVDGDVGSVLLKQGQIQG